MTKTCSYCGKQFARNFKHSRIQWEKIKTCDDDCRILLRYGPKSKCVVCKKDFRPRRKDVKCCSIKCGGVNKRIPTKSKRCTVCLKTFYREIGVGIKNWERQKSCSSACRTKRIKAHKIGYKVGHKGYKNSGSFEKGIIPWNTGLKGVTIPPTRKGCKPWNKGKKNILSEISKEKMRIARAKQDMSHLRGENHHNWKGGITPIRNAIRALYQYVEWRKSIFERDNYTCQGCKKRGGKLNADHVKSFSKILNENNIQTTEHAKSCAELWDLSNGRTLCDKCHLKTDTYGGLSIG